MESERLCHERDTILPVSPTVRCVKCLASLWLLYFIMLHILIIFQHFASNTKIKSIRCQMCQICVKTVLSFLTYKRLSTLCVIYVSVSTEKCLSPPNIKIISNSCQIFVNCLSNLSSQQLLGLYYVKNKSILYRA